MNAIDADMIIDGLIKTISAGFFTYKISNSIVKDKTHCTTRNTIKTVLVSAAEVLGANTGYNAGAAIGHTLNGLSRVEPKYTGIACGVLAGILVGYGAGKLVSAVSERVLTAFDYDIVIRCCLNCNKMFGNLLYEGEMKGLCPECDAARAERIMSRHGR
ncbi:hypothetical protein CAEBREN_01993 [Caenorhabditis brenneri]|uniref:Uncharacterized protein n=1 Tax=Caenorhabditis brenneri TaxID=135651 RepID=G0NGP0_CAEBE|nr:hypothetical protein CAEBREN_01993 [Caenorhabditis brenneri]